MTFFGRGGGGNVTLLNIHCSLNIQYVHYASSVKIAQINFYYYNNSYYYKKNSLLDSF